MFSMEFCITCLLQMYTQYVGNHDVATEELNKLNSSSKVHHRSQASSGAFLRHVAFAVISIVPNKSHAGSEMYFHATSMSIAQFTSHSWQQHSIGSANHSNSTSVRYDAILIYFLPRLSQTALQIADTR